MLGNNHNYGNGDDINDELYAMHQRQIGEIPMTTGMSRQLEKR